MMLRQGIDQHAEGQKATQCMLVDTESCHCLSNEFPCRNAKG